MKPVSDLLKTSERIQNIILKGFDPVSAGGFTQIPNVLIRTPKLASTTKLVYAQLLSYAWNNNLVFPGQERLADDIGASLATITRSIRELVNQEWLDVTRRGQGKTNVYELKFIVDKSVQKWTWFVKYDESWFVTGGILDSSNMTIQNSLNFEAREEYKEWIIHRWKNT